MPILPLIIAHLVPTLDHVCFCEKVPFCSGIVLFRQKKELNYLKKVPFVLKKCPLGRKCAALLRKSALLLENSALLLESSALLPEKIAFSRLLPPNLILPTAALLELNELFL